MTRFSVQPSQAAPSPSLKIDLAMKGIGLVLLTLLLAQLGAQTLPIITSFSPASGPEGTRVEIHGASFHEVRAVKFGNLSALYRITTDSTIIALVPMHAPTGPITVVGNGGRANTTAPFVVENDPRIPDEVRYKTGYVTVLPRPTDFGFALLWGAAIADTRFPSHESAEVEIAWTELSGRIDGRTVLLYRDAGKIRGGLYQRAPWFSGNQHEPMPSGALHSPSPDGPALMRVGQIPDRIWHFWSASGRTKIPPGHLEGCTAKALVRISPGALLQLGMDYWRDAGSLWAPHERNNHEAGASRWYFPSPAWQEVVFSDIPELASDILPGR
jgi:hypothetical protein